MINEVKNMEYQTMELYDRDYDDPSKRSKSKLLGTFQIIENIESDISLQLFIARNVHTGEVYLFHGFEICGFESGTKYTVYPLKHLCVKE